MRPAPQALDLRGRIEVCDPATLLALSAGFATASVLHAAVELRVFSLLGDEPMTAVALASGLGLSARGLDRLLVALAALGLVEGRLDEHLRPLGHLDEHLHARGLERRWRAHAIARDMLAPDAPFAQVLLQQRRQLYRLFFHLPEAVRSGAPQLEHWQLGDGPRGPTQAADCYQRLQDEPAAFDLFLGAMNAASIGVGQVIADQFDLGAIARLVDLGGGGGQVAVELLVAARHLVIDLVDFAPACARATALAERAGVAERLRVHAGDLFEPSWVPPAADAVLLSGVLGDFGGDEQRRLLARARGLLGPRGSLLVSETLLDDDRQGPILPSLLSLNMLLAAQGGNHTAAELSAILAGGGFATVRVFRNGARGVRDLIVAHTDD